MITTTHSIEETKQLAADFAASLKGGEVIALHGELGAGKTAFTQGLAEALGAKGPVRSPTFTVMNHYQIGRDDIREIVHLDLYRFETLSDIGALGLEEWLFRKDNIIVIEWPKEGLDFPNRIDIHFELLSETERQITIQK